MMMSLTPMLKQYRSIRGTLAHDAVMFFRMGDFYEMFYEDAKRAAGILDITLTARDGGSGTKVPMCGVPFHSAQNYINRLTRAGIKVAICEQVEDPKAAKGIVKREIVRFVTPSTNLEDEPETPAAFNYIAAVYRVKKLWGVACIDLSTGDFQVGEYDSDRELQDELLRLSPKECVLPEAFDVQGLKHFFAEIKPVLNKYDEWIFDLSDARKRLSEQFEVATVSGFGLEGFTAGLCCAGALLYYLQDNLHKSISHIKRPVPAKNPHYMTLDRQTISNLELFSLNSDKSRSPTLYSVVNKTVTAMGARLLLTWLARPLVDPERVSKRLEAVEALYVSPDPMASVQGLLSRVKDIERLIARINCGTPSARDMVALGVSLGNIPELKRVIAGMNAPIIVKQREDLFDLKELTDEIDRALVDSPPVHMRDGGFIKDGYSTELDELRNISIHAKQWIASLQKQEIEKTGIKSLKIRYNKVFGYYIDVTKANLDMVPDYYQRKQTLVNSERFSIPLLKEYEEKILTADEKAKQLEQEIFSSLRAQALEYIEQIQRTAHAVAVLDVLCSCAGYALENNCCKPDVSSGSKIYIAGGRHPVVEKTSAEGRFVDNDVLLDTAENQLLIITGPNMAGKSTYIRQVALLVLMAQSGLFVPARVANIGMVDRVFSRIGAADNLSRGESTFMVEMTETSNILHNATTRSLIVFDEIGRGTSTFDGLSIAWSVCEYISRKSLRPKCLFATHYHELTELADHKYGIKNFNVTVKEVDDSVLFLRKVLPGGADRSYGIHVAKLAGLPPMVVERAKEVLICLEEEKISEESISKILSRKKKTASIYDLPIFKALKSADPPDEAPRALDAPLPDPHPVIQEIADMDVNRTTPMEALNLINRWKERVSSEKKERDDKKCAGV